MSHLSETCRKKRSITGSLHEIGSLPKIEPTFTRSCFPTGQCLNLVTLGQTITEQNRIQPVNISAELDHSISFPSGILYTLIRSPWVLCCPGWTVPALSVSPHDRGSIPSSSLWFCNAVSGKSMCVLSLGAQNCKSLDVSHQCGAEGKDYGPWLALLILLTVLLAAQSAAGAHHWLTLIFLSTRTSRSSFANLLSSWTAPSLTWCMEFFAFPFVELIEFPVSMFLEPNNAAEGSPSFWIYQAFLQVLYHLQTCWW